MKIIKHKEEKHFTTSKNSIKKFETIKLTKLKQLTSLLQQMRSEHLTWRPEKANRKRLRQIEKYNTDNSIFKRNVTGTKSIMK